MKRSEFHQATYNEVLRLLEEKHKYMDTNTLLKVRKILDKFDTESCFIVTDDMLDNVYNSLTDNYTLQYDVGEFQFVATFTDSENDKITFSYVPETDDRWPKIQISLNDVYIGTLGTNYIDQAKEVLTSKIPDLNFQMYVERSDEQQDSDMYN